MIETAPYRMDASTEVRDASPLGSVAVAIGLTILGLVGSELFTLPAVAIDPNLATNPSATSVELRTVFMALNFVGMAVIGALYLALTDRGWSYVDLRLPTKRDWLYVLGGIVASVLLYLGSIVVITLLDLPAADNQIVAYVDTPTMVLIMIGIVFLFNAPAEEFLFRNVVQKRLTEAFTDASAILIASLVFAGIHLPVYMAFAETFLAALVPVVIVFVASLIFGTIYATTANLVVPTIAHAVYNAMIFGLLYVSMVYDLESTEAPTQAVVDALALLPV